MRSKPWVCPHFYPDFCHLLAGLSWLRQNCRCRTVIRNSAIGCRGYQLQGVSCLRLMKYNIVSCIKLQFLGEFGWKKIVNRHVIRYENILPLEKNCISDFASCNVKQNGETGSDIRQIATPILKTKPRPKINDYVMLPIFFICMQIVIAYTHVHWYYI